MDKVFGMLVYGEVVVQEFIYMFIIQVKLIFKILREYVSDLKYFFEWCKGSIVFGEKDIRIENINIFMLMSYCDYLQNVLQLKLVMINCRLIILKCLFKWVVVEFKISSDFFKFLKFIFEDKVSFC